MTRPLAVAAPRPTPSSKAPRSASTRDPWRLRFGEFELIAESCELLRRDRLGAPRRVKLQPQPARALLFLAERSGRLVTRTELQRHLWGENHFVDYEQGLNYCIRSIRRALGDDASAPSFLETVPRRGYRFTRGVDVSERPVGLSAATEHAARRRTLSSRPGGVNERRLALVLAAVVVLSLALHWALSAGLLQSPGPARAAQAGGTAVRRPHRRPLREPARRQPRRRADLAPGGQLSGPARSDRAHLLGRLRRGAG